MKKPVLQSGLYCYACNAPLKGGLHCTNLMGNCPVAHLATMAEQTLPEYKELPPAIDQKPKYVGIDYGSLEAKVLATVSLEPMQGKALTLEQKQFEKIKKFGQMYGMGKDKFLSAYMEGDMLTEAKLAEYYKLLSSKYNANDVGFDSYVEPDFALEWFKLHKPYPTQGGDIVTLVEHGTYGSIADNGRTYKNDPSSEYHGHVVVAVGAGKSLQYTVSESPLNLIPEPLFTWLDNDGQPEGHMTL